MVGKKQPTRKPRRNEEGVPQIKAQCPLCIWQTRLTTRENVRGEMLLHQNQFHHFAPVRQVEDSEDRVAEDTSNQEVITTVLDLAQDHQMDRAPTKASKSDKVAEDIPNWEVITTVPDLALNHKMDRASTQAQTLSMWLKTSPTRR